MNENDDDPFDLGPFDLKKSLPPDEYKARLQRAREVTERDKRAVPSMPKPASDKPPAQVAQETKKKEKSRVRVEQLLAKKTGETGKMPAAGRAALAIINTAEKEPTMNTNVETTKTTAKKAPPKTSKKAAAPKAKAKTLAHDEVAEARAATKAKAKPTKATTTATLGVGAVAKEAIMKGLDNDEVLTAVRKVHPGRSNLDCVAWYRMDLKRKGFNVPPLARTPKALVAKAAKKTKKVSKKAN